jgi:hypothetical protein
MQGCHGFSMVQTLCKAPKSESNKHVSIDRFSQCCPAIIVLSGKRIGKCEKYPTGKRKRLLVEIQSYKRKQATLKVACRNFGGPTAAQISLI